MADFWCDWHNCKHSNVAEWMYDQCLSNGWDCFGNGWDCFDCPYLLDSNPDGDDEEPT